MYYSAPLLENSARSPCSEYAIPALPSSSSSTERGLTFHLRPPRGRLPFSSSLSLTARHYSLLPACVMRAGQNGIADKSWGTGRRGRSDKVRLDIRAVREQQSLLSFFSLFSFFFFFPYAFSWLERFSVFFPVSMVQFTSGYSRFPSGHAGKSTRVERGEGLREKGGRKENRVERASEEREKRSEENNV